MDKWEELKRVVTKLYNEKDEEETDSSDLEYGKKLGYVWAYAEVLFQMELMEKSEAGADK